MQKIQCPETHTDTYIVPENELQEMKDKNWGMGERILCMVIWPLSLSLFIIAFVKQYFIK